MHEDRNLTDLCAEDCTIFLGVYTFLAADFEATTRANSTRQAGVALA